MDDLEISYAYSNAVPPRYIAEYVLCPIDDCERIAEERESFRKFIVNELATCPDLFRSQADAWDVYTWSWDEWQGRKESDLVARDEEELVWESYLYGALMEQVRPDNVDPETGGQM